MSAPVTLSRTSRRPSETDVLGSSSTTVPSIFLIRPDDEVTSDTLSPFCGQPVALLNVTSKTRVAVARILFMMSIIRV